MSKSKFSEWQKREMYYLATETDLGNRVIGEWYGASGNYVSKLKSQDIRPVRPDLKKLQKMRRELNEHKIDFQKLSRKAKRHVKMHYYKNSEYRDYEMPGTGSRSIKRWKREGVEPIKEWSKATGLDSVIEEAKRNVKDR